MVSELFLVNQLPLLKIGIVDLTVRFITQINHASPGMYNTCAVVPSTLLAELEITDTDENPSAYRMKIFAANEINAMSRFWYFMHQIRKMKKTTGEILDVNEVGDHSHQFKSCSFMSTHQ